MCIILLNRIRYVFFTLFFIVVFYEILFTNHPDLNTLTSSFMMAGFCSIISYHRPCIKDNLEEVKNKYISGEIDINTLENLAENQILSERI